MDRTQRADLRSAPTQAALEKGFELLGTSSSPFPRSSACKRLPFSKGSKSVKISLHWMMFVRLIALRETTSSLASSRGARSRVGGDSEKAKSNECSSIRSHNCSFSTVDELALEALSLNYSTQRAQEQLFFSRTSRYFWPLHLRLRQPPRLSSSLTSVLHTLVVHNMSVAFPALRPSRIHQPSREYSAALSPAHTRYV